MTRKAEYLTRASRDSSTFDNTYQTLGGSFGSPAVLIKVVNNSDTDIDISLNGGTTAHDFCPADSFFLYDLRANHGKEDDFVFPIGTQVHVRGAAAGTGLVYRIIIAEVS